MKTIIVVPCYNEALRLVPDGFRAIVESTPQTTIVFVDDGSSDATTFVIEGIASAIDSQVLVLGRNMGKAEAVRQGLLRALEANPEWVGYTDADLATPPEEIARLLRVSHGSPGLDIVFGSRIRLCGSNVNRRLSRHLLGRVFATVADWVLEAHVYDSQAGAKFFRNTAELKRALEAPFTDRWAFDVELLGRLGRLGSFPARAVEVPLQTWLDREGSKVTPLQGARSLVTLIRIKRRLNQFPTN